MQTQKTNCISSPLQKGDYRGIKKQAFTLVELIVVITILAILATIAFISLSGYSQDARNSSRVADVKTIEKSLQIYSTRNDTFPLPENPQEVTYDDGTNGEDVIYYQGTFGSSPYKEVGNLSNIPIDPLTKTQYIYSTTVNKNQYEILAIYEGQTVNNPILNQTHAAETYKPKVTGTYNKIFVKTASYYVPLPSLINSEVTNTGITLNSSNIKSHIITNGNNLPQIGTTITQSTGAIQNLNLSVYTGGTITSTSTDTDKENLAKKIQEAYSGSDLATTQIYANILNKTTTDELVALVNSVVLGNGANNAVAQVTLINGLCGVDNSQNLTSTPTNLCSAGTQTSVTDNGVGNTYDWSCTGQDLGTTASCSANHVALTCTAGQGFNGTSCVAATECSPGLESLTLANGQTWSCLNLGATTVWNGTDSITNCGGSATNCNSSLTWVGDYYQWGRNDAGWTNGQSGWSYDWQSPQVDTAWGGSTGDTPASDGAGTTATGRQGVCPTGWHIPSVKDWQDLCNQVTGTTCTNGMTYNSVISSVLKLPFAGYRNRLTGSYFYQSSNANYWSSSPNSTHAYILYFHSSRINPSTFNNRAYGFTVRCIKN